MKILVVLLILVVFATATPAIFPADIETFKQNGVLSSQDASNRRTKKATFIPQEEVLFDDNNSEKDSKNSHLTEARNLGLIKPIVIKKIGYHRYRDSHEEREANLREDCKNQMRVQVCNDEGPKSLNQVRIKKPEQSEIIMSEQEMENSIKMAKEAVEHLHRELHKIKETAPKSSDRVRLDNDLHKNIEIARKALENIQENFRNLEAINAGDPSTDKINLKTSDEARFTQWKEAIENIQKNFDTVNNISDKFNKKSETSLSARDLEQMEEMKARGKFESLTDKLKENIDATKNSDNLVDMRTTDLDLQRSMKEENSEQEQPSKLLQSESEIKGMKIDKEDSAMKELNNQVEDSDSNKLTKDTNSLNKEEENGSSDLTVISKDHIDEKHEMNQPSSKITEENGSEMQKQKLLETLSMQLAEKSQTQQKDFPGHSESSNKGHENMNSEPMHHQLSQENVKHEEKQNTPVNSRVSMMNQIHRHEFSIPEMNVAQNNLNLFQNQDNIVDINENNQQEDPFFRRWATEQRQKDMLLKNANIHHEYYKTPQLNDLSLGGNDELSVASTNLNNHVHVMHHHGMDNAMHSSMRMKLRDDPGKSSMELNGMQWNNQAPLRSSYGSPSSSYGSPSSPAADSLSGAVGIFPNAKIGGCAIPLLVSCSPSLVSGSLAKTSHPQPHPAYTVPGYRSGDDMVYYMKRDTEVDDPILKFQQPLKPYTHKIVFDQNH